MWENFVRPAKMAGPIPGKKVQIVEAIDGQAEPSLVPNVALDWAMKSKGVSARKLARAIGVTEITVRRWLENVQIKVRLDNAQAAARQLGCTPHDLWPDQFSASQEPSSTMGDKHVRFNPALYASRTEVPITVWQNHFDHARSAIDILAFAATFLFDTLDGFTATLADAARRGVQIRFLIGDPDGDNTALRGKEEGIGESVHARSHNSVELLRPYTTTPGLDVRTHETTLYTSIFRVDDDMIVNFHIYGSPGRDNPVMVFSRQQEPRLWATFERAFTRVWDNARPLTSPANPLP
jgi:lambda repressor-like predicted transcriptional regulator